jgi:hypothetical protein
MIRIIEDLSGEWRHLDERIEHVTEEIEVLAHGTESCRQLMTVPGIGPIIASAMVAAIGNGVAFAKGRDFAAWLGLVPKQMSTGDRTILGRISKRGNRYLRMLFMQGARVVLLRPANWAKHSFGPWLTAAAKRLHYNVLATALANKLARIAWTILTQRRSYEARRHASRRTDSAPALRTGASRRPSRHYSISFRSASWITLAHLSVFGDEKLAEFRRRSAEHHAAEIGEFLFRFGIGERVVDRLVQHTDDFRRRGFRRVEPIKGADLVAGQEIGNARRVGQRVRAHGGGDAERTELPVADKADRARQVVEGRLHSAAQEIGIGITLMRECMAQTSNLLA